MKKYKRLIALLVNLILFLTPVSLTSVLVSDINYCYSGNPYEKKSTADHKPETEIVKCNPYIKNIYTLTSSPLELSIDVQQVCRFTQDEMDLLAQIVYSEAGNQPDEGIRLVCDCILNRVDSERWPDTIHDVIYQKGQFGPVWNGGLEKWGPRTTDIVKQIVAEEVACRTNQNVIFFNTSPIGKNCFQVGAHYFGQ